MGRAVAIEMPKDDPVGVVNLLRRHGIEVWALGCAEWPDLYECQTDGWRVRVLIGDSRWAAVGKTLVLMAPAMAPSAARFIEQIADVLTAGGGVRLVVSRARRGNA